MSPVWVKLGDFGVSKRIRAQTTTTFHTQVSTQVYSAPEILGLDSNSETSDYTNSVDIWSLGCVIYELLAGARLFASEAQVSRYYFGKYPFPENTLKGLSLPTDHLGILLLKSMLLIQPEDRPTAPDALVHDWLAGLKSDKKDCGDDQDEKTESLDQSTPCSSCENRPARNDEPEKRRSKRNSLSTRDNICYIPGDVGLRVNSGSRKGGHPTSPDTMIDTPAPRPDATSTQSAVGQRRVRKPELGSRNFLKTRSGGIKPREKKHIRHLLQTCPQGSPP